MARYRPDDYQPPARSGGGASNGKLADAMELAQARPNIWVDVHEPREMDKAPTSWCSEVNQHKKKQLRDALPGPGYRWQANYEATRSGATWLYTKMIRLVPPVQRDPSAPVPAPPELPEIQPVPSAPYGSQ